MESLKKAVCNLIIISLTLGILTGCTSSNKSEEFIPIDPKSIVIPEYNFIYSIFDYNSNAKSAYIDEIKADYNQAVALYNKVESLYKEYTERNDDDDLSQKNIKERIDNLRNLKIKADKFYNNQQWTDCGKTSREILRTGNDVLPLLVDEAGLYNLYKDYNEIKKAAINRKDELKKQIIKTETEKELSYDGWYNLAYVEDRIAEIENNLLLQIEEAFTRFRKALLTSQSGVNEEKRRELQRELQSIISLLQMVSESVDLCDIINKYYITEGELSLGERQKIVKEKKESLEAKINDFDLSKIEKMYAAELIRFARESKVSGEVAEKENFWGLAFFHYYLGDIFAGIANEWKEIPQAFQEDLVKKMPPPPPSEIEKELKRAAELLEDVNSKFAHLAENNIYALHLREMARIFYSWIRGGVRII
ncbi:MAG: hypothetical protein L5655_11915 [Thermosediminibacteraceae bacterium]|nr:hypothetical protein [Thermosediminibacteraceae bacterium]